MAPQNHPLKLVSSVFPILICTLNGVNFRGNARSLRPDTWKSSLLSKDPSGLQKQHQHHYRGNIADHHPVELLAAEGLAVALHLVNDVIRRHDPADQDGGQQGNERHHNTVADVVHDIQQLRRRAVGQLYLKIEDAVTQRNDGGRGQINDRQHKYRLFAARVEDLHAVGGDGFQHRDAGGQGGKNSGDEEQDAHESAGLAHSGKHLGQRDEHQAGACAHALGAGEHIHGGDDHGTGQQSHAGIKNFDLIHCLVQVYYQENRTVMINMIVGMRCLQRKSNIKKGQ